MRKGQREVMDRLIIYAADIGSVEKRNFGWARRVAESVASEVREGNTPGSLVADVAADLRRGAPVALGFECPQWMDIRDDPRHLTKARDGEGNRAWSAGAGAGALATGIVQTVWLLREIRGSAGKAEVFLDWVSFAAAGGGLFLWEAFVTKRAKAKTHQGDAKAAVDAFASAMPTPPAANAVRPRGAVISLLGAALLWSDWVTDTAVIREPCLVVRAQEK